MNFNQHYELEGKHAFLGASKYSWLNYDEDHLVQAYERYFAKEYGTRLHGFAKDAIELRQKLPSNGQTLNQYVNDAIKYRMKPEQPLFYSYNCFGTADAISFRRNTLRIHDLKTGVTPAHMEQLVIYAALFCLEYSVDPNKITVILRIYQSNTYQEYEPPAAEIKDVCDKVIRFDEILTRIRLEGTA